MNFYTIFISLWLILTIFILYILYWGGGYQLKASRVYYLVVIIIGSIFSLSALMSRFLAYVGGIQLLFIVFTADRWINKFMKHSNDRE